MSVYTAEFSSPLGMPLFKITLGIKCGIEFECYLLTFPSPQQEKALIAAQLENAIEKELLDRLKQGTVCGSLAHAFPAFVPDQ